MTGGDGGIGKNTVKPLVDKGGRVVVIHVIPLVFDARGLSPSCINIFHKLLASRGNTAKNIYYYNAISPHPPIFPPPLLK